MRFNLVLEHTVELYRFLQTNFSAPYSNSSDSNVIVAEMDEEDRGGIEIIDNGPVELFSPLSDLRMRVSLFDGSYSCDLSFGIQETKALKNMRVKMKNRLGDAWSPLTKELIDFRGFFLDSQRNPIVSGSFVPMVVDTGGNLVSLPRYRLSLGNSGTVPRSLGEIDTFTQEMGILQRVASAFYDSCYSGRRAWDRGSALPSNLYFSCLL